MGEQPINRVNSKTTGIRTASWNGISKIDGKEQLSHVLSYQYYDRKSGTYVTRGSMMIYGKAELEETLLVLQETYDKLYLEESVPAKLDKNEVKTKKAVKVTA